MRKQAEVQLFEEKEKAQVTLESIGDAVITADAEGRVEYLNPVAEQLTGWDSAEAAGRPVGEVIHLVGESSRLPLENPIVRCLREGRMVEMDEQSLLINRRGIEISIQDSAAPIRDRGGRLVGVVMVFHDVSQERRLQRALVYQASHDALTGLINRREFESRLNEALLAARSRDGVSHVLLYLDLDQFKVVNDTCGHQAGDRLLKQLTSVVQTRIRTTDTLARLGGDEFGVLLQDCTLETAQRIAENLRQAIRDFRFVWQDRVMNVGVSIGLAEITAHSESLAAVMSAADVACYSAKDSGRNRVQTYRQGRAPERHREMQWVSRINRACEEDRLLLVCQPIVPIRAGVEKLRHFELLLRMKDENGALVQPSEFIPAAERFNLMPALDRWVVRQACTRHVHRRGDTGRAPFILAINVSATTLNDEQFLDFVLAEMAAADVSPGRAVLRDDRDGRHEQPRQCKALRPRAARARLPVRARRLRQRALVLHIPEEPAGRLPEDRRAVHAQRGARPGRSRTGRGHRADRSDDGDPHDRRTGRFRGGADAARRHRHRVCAGALYRGAAAGRGAGNADRARTGRDPPHRLRRSSGLLEPRRTTPLVFLERALAEPYRLRRHLDQLVVVDELHRLLERHPHRIGQDDVLVAAGGADVGELLGLERVDDQVVVAAVDADDLALVDLVAVRDHQPTAFLEVEERIGEHGALARLRS